MENIKTDDILETTSIEDSSTEEIGVLGSLFNLLELIKKLEESK